MGPGSPSRGSRGVRVQVGAGLRDGNGCSPFGEFRRFRREIHRDFHLCRSTTTIYAPAGGASLLVEKPLGLSGSGGFSLLARLLAVATLPAMTRARSEASGLVGGAGGVAARGEARRVPGAGGRRPLSELRDVGSDLRAVRSVAGIHGAAVLRRVGGASAQCHGLSQRAGALPPSLRNPVSRRRLLGARATSPVGGAAPKTRAPGPRSGGRFLSSRGARR